MTTLSKTMLSIGSLSTLTFGITLYKYNLSKMTLDPYAEYHNT